LEALVKERLESGDPPGASVAEAIRQFGDPGQLGKEWLKSRKRAIQRPLDGRAMHRQILTALGVSAMIGPPASAFAGWSIFWLGGGGIAHPPSWAATLWTGFLFGPLFASLYGLISDSSARWRAWFRTSFVMMGLALSLHFIGFDHEYMMIFMPSYVCILSLGIVVLHSLGLKLLNFGMKEIGGPPTPT
jgi:hypothetical protein